MVGKIWAENNSVKDYKGKYEESGFLHSPCQLEYNKVKLCYYFWTYIEGRYELLLLLLHVLFYLQITSTILTSSIICIYKMKLLDERVAIITGSTKGNGRAMANLFSEHGANVIVTGRDKVG